MEAMEAIVDFPGTGSLASDAARDFVGAEEQRKFRAVCMH